MNEVVLQSGIEKARIFDIRGNHDKYGVPYVSHELDFFSKYSVNAELNRTADIYSISLLVCYLSLYLSLSLIPLAEALSLSPLPLLLTCF